MPMQEAIFLEICSICTFQVRFSSIYTPRDFVNSTCFIELPSVVKNVSTKEGTFHMTCLFICNEITLEKCNPVGRTIVSTVPPNDKN